MHCPVCKNHSLKLQDIETGLKAQECPKCKGRWIASYLYWKWKESTGKTLLQSSGELNLSVNDSKNAKLCPECGHFLRRYPVSEDLGFALDRCSNCGGTWFDENEWEILKARGLHDDVHMIFSNMWQNQIRDRQRQLNAETLYKKIFGDADYKKAQEIKNWLSNHPHQPELKAFLNL